MAIFYSDMSDIGCVREINQDRIYADVKGEYGIFVVADGMGGHARGELASGQAVKMLSDWWKRNYTVVRQQKFEESVNVLEKLIEKMNTEIFSMYEEMGLQGGTTFSMLLLHENRYGFLTIGDSRIYQHERKKFHQISVDDVWENLSENRLKPLPDLQKDIRYGTLSQALGYDRQVCPRVHTGVCEKKSSFLICSDGVYKFLPEKKMKKIMKKAEKKAELSSLLMQMKKEIYKEGAGDNLSAIMIGFHPA